MNKLAKHKTVRFMCELYREVTKLCKEILLFCSPFLHFSHILKSMQHVYGGFDVLLIQG